MQLHQSEINLTPWVTCYYLDYYEGWPHIDSATKCNPLIAAMFRKTMKTSYSSMLVWWWADWPDDNSSQGHHSFAIYFTPPQFHECALNTLKTWNVFKVLSTVRLHSLQCSSEGKVTSQLQLSTQTKGLKSSIKIYKSTSDYVRKHSHMNHVLGELWIVNVF